MFISFTDNKSGEAHRSTKHSFQHGHRGLEGEAEPGEREAAGAAERAGEAGALRHAGLATTAADSGLLHVPALLGRPTGRDFGNTHSR